MKEPLQVSIAMATYNGERHIREQLESLASQTRLPHELVVTDDCSSDQTLEIVANFALNAPFPVRVIRNESNLGFADNFLKAAALCGGDVIAFCDQDDKWLPGKLATCLEAFADPDVVVCVHTSRLWYGGERFGDCVPHFRERQSLPAAGVDPLANHLGFSNLFRREVLRVADHSVRPRHPNVVGGVAHESHAMVHDQWIWFLGSMIGKVVLIPEVQCFYRQHSGNTLGFTYKAPALRTRLELDRARVFARGEEVALECAAFAEALGAKLPEQTRASVQRACMTMRQRAAVCGFRKKIYSPESGVSARIKAFFGVVGVHGYRAHAPLFSFGRAAFIKDIVVGITGLSRLFGPARGGL